MFARDLRSSILDLSENLKTTMNPAVDEALKEVHKDFKDGRGNQYVGCTQLCIEFDDVDVDADTYHSTGVHRIFFGDDTKPEDYELVPFQEFISRPQSEWERDEVAGTCGGKILQLSYFAKQLEIRGLKCYVDLDDGSLQALLKMNS